VKTNNALKPETGDQTFPLMSIAAELARIAGQISECAADLSYRNADSKGYRGKITTETKTVSPVGAFAQRLLNERRQRDTVMDARFFGEPAWDMLLDLFVAQENRRRPVSVSSLCIASAVPSTTGLRWINSMVKSGMLLRRPDPSDGRRVWIDLAPHVHHQMRALLSSWMKDVNP
jgi:DNA-binding MarR family transcriptional regulator